MIIFHLVLQQHWIIKAVRKKMKYLYTFENNFKIIWCPSYLKKIINRRNCPQGRGKQALRVSVHLFCSILHRKFLPVAVTRNSLVTACQTWIPGGIKQSHQFPGDGWSFCVSVWQGYLYVMGSVFALNVLPVIVGLCWIRGILLLFMAFLCREGHTCSYWGCPVTEPC